MAKRKPLTLARVMKAVERDDYTGFCRTCGASADSVEPDADGYLCCHCGERTVAGAEQLLMEMS